jgi:transposase
MSHSQIADVAKEFVKHMAWVYERMRYHSLRLEIETYTQFREAILDEARQHKISREIMLVILNELETRNPELFNRNETDHVEAPAQGTGAEIPPPGTPPPSSVKDKPSHQSGTQSNPPQPDPQKPSRRGVKKKGKKGQNRKGRRAGQRNLIPADFRSAVHIHVTFGEDLHVGSACPCCRSRKLEASRPSELIRFVAQPPIEARIYHVERARCRGCGQEFEAELPVDVRRDIVVAKCDPAAAALSIFLRFGMGMPDLRLEEWLKCVDVPFSHSRQWQIASSVFDDLQPLWDAFEAFVANAELREVDDCSARVIETALQIGFEQERALECGYKGSAVRTGIQMTVFIARKGDVTLRWFRIGRAHQGEREHELLQKRTCENSSVRITDAATKANSVKPFPETNEHGFVPTKAGQPAALSATVQAAFCWEHLRQQFEKGEPGFKEESAPLFRMLGQIFDNDKVCAGWSAEERTSYHREHSAPLVDAMEKYAHEQLTSNSKAEPNGAFARGLRYFLGNLAGLKTFLTIDGVPLTTSFAEAGAKFTKRHNKNSLSFQTERGALVGAFFMSLIASCKGMGKNPLEYLTALIRWRHAINPKNATGWLPQCFEDAIAAAQIAHPPPTNGFTLRPRRPKPDPDLQKAADILPVAHPLSSGPPTENGACTIN